MDDKNIAKVVKNVCGLKLLYVPRICKVANVFMRNGKHTSYHHNNKIF